LPTPELIIAGASARAAAFSAARAGYRPFWIDQFGDRDLAGAFPGRRVAPGAYPQGIVEAVKAAPDAPFMYTGALENHAGVLADLAARRELLGNPPDVCAAVRDPWQVASCLARQGLRFPALCRPSEPPPAGAWLVKPIRGAGGAGIARFTGSRPPAHAYLQQFVHGDPRSAVFAGDGRRAVLLGVSRQLVGLPEFGAAPFAYCGSIGPLQLEDREAAAWRAIGNALAGNFGLRGLFGVDAVIAEGEVVCIEINPRYTASVEVHELALGINALHWHAGGCRGELPPAPSTSARHFVGKAYLFAQGSLRVPANLPEAVAGTAGLLGLADLPWPGSTISAGAPVLTMLVKAGDGSACARLLARVAGLLYRVPGCEGPAGSSGEHGE
jgi:predicted ATP-grasp superfamily ATP-dependent carboligase